MNRKDNVTLDEILDEIMLQEREPSHKALLRWCKEYPEHQVALMRFFATWALQDEKDDVPVIDEDRVASRMVSHALNLLHSAGAAVQICETKGLPSRLHQMIKLSGKSDEQLIDACGLDDSLIAKLDRHLISFGSIPRSCLDRLAAAINCVVDDVIRVVSGEPILALDHKAKKKPVVFQETFLEAVELSNLSAEQKETWKRIVSEESK